MAYSNITSASNAQSANLPLGLLIQIAFTNGIRNQISTDFRDFEYIKRAKVANSLARELRFMFQTSLGPAAIQYRNPGTPSRQFPSSQNVSTSEYSAVLKEINTTIELEYGVFDRARKNPEKYGDPVQVELDSKMSAAKRRLAADFYGDGTGVLGTVVSAAVTSPASDKLVFTLSSVARGHVGLFEYDDILVLKSNAGSASALDTNLATEPAYWKVVDKNRDNNTVTLQGLTAGLAPVASISAISVQPTAGDVFYRYGQPTQDINLSSISDYGTVSEVIAGLDSLVANDGRVIHGITMSGATAGSHFDAGGNPLDVKHVQKLMSKVKLAVGQDRYRWRQLLMSPESLDTLIESRETDRRFNTVEDSKRGTKSFSYIHGNDTLECVTSEYCPQNKIYCLPETKGGEKVIEFHGSDFETVKGQDMTDFHLKVDSGYRNAMVSYLQATGVMICNHPAAIGVIKNFVNT